MNFIAPEKLNLTHTLCFLFSGKAGVGKSYCSNIILEIVNFYHLKARLFPFTRGVKATATFMGWDGKKDQRGRKLLQVIGQGGREYHPDTWVRSTFIDIEESVGYPYDVVVIDDWRFKNEVDYILQNELLYRPIRIRVVAPDREVLKGTPEYDEISEIELDNYPSFDYVIDNSIDGKEGVEAKLLSIFLRESLRYSRI